MNGGIMKGLLLLFGLGFMLCFGVTLATGGKEEADTGGGTGKQQVQAPASLPGTKTGSVSSGAAPASTSPSSQPGSGGIKAQAGAVTAANARTIQAAATRAEAGSAGSEQRDTVKAGETTADPGIIMKPSFVNHASNRMGDALRRGARALIGGVVSVFDAVTGS